MTRYFLALMIGWSVGLALWWSTGFLHNFPIIPILASYVAATYVLVATR